MKWFKVSLLSILILGLSCKSSKKTNANNADLPIFKSESIVYVKDFGAIPNDNKNDDTALQKAIDFAIQQSKSSLVILEAGVYDLKNGLVVANKNKNTSNYDYVTIKITGPLQAYTANQLTGKSTVLKSKSNTFTLAIQSGRNCVIENIMFEGNANYVNNFNTQPYNSDTTIWGHQANVRINSYAPSCAIAIDPFHKEIPNENYYSGFESYYSNERRTGTSMCLIRGCSFSKYFIAISNNSSSWCQNGDNIKSENCHSEYCFVFWAAGQDQSRANSIENLYSVHTHTIVNCTYIGTGRGTPPTLSHINVAGYTKELFEVRTGFSGVWATQCYFENLWSIGSIESNLVSFNQCQFKFMRPSSEYYSAPCLLYSNSVVRFIDCSLEYFNNCESPAPFVFISRNLVIEGGHVEGGVIVSNGITNAGGDDIHQVDFKNVSIKCKNSIAGTNWSGKHITKLTNQIFLGGSTFTTYDNKIFTNSQSTFDCFATEKVKIEISDKNKTAQFKTNKIGLYKLGDNVFAENSIIHKRSFLEPVEIRTAIGYISKITDNIVEISGISQTLQSKQFDLYLVDYPIFFPELFISCQKNSQVAKIIGNQEGLKPTIGTRINSNYFPKGTYITQIKNNEIWLSMPASKEVDSLILFNQQQTK